MATRAASRKATDVLERLIAQARDTHQYRLPNVKQLCALAGVCNVTMLKAVRRLREQGIVSVSHGRGIRVVAPAPGHAVPQEGSQRKPGRKWQRLRAALDRDIVQGVYPAGAELPSPKELAGRYGVCYRTLKRALDSLVEAGDIVPCRRSYRVPVFSSAQHANTVVLLGAPASSSSMLEPSSRTLQYLRTLEQECSRSGIELTTLSLDESLPRLHQADSLLGSVLWASGVARGPMARVLEHLARSRKPVSVFDDLGAFRPPQAAGGKFRVFSVANSPQAGRKAGRYLLNLGHRNIAYISPYHHDDWSQRRLQGLTSAFETAGFPNGVRTFVLESIPYPAAVMGSTLSLQRALDSLLGRAPLLLRRAKSNAALVSTARTLRSQLHALRKEAVRARLGSLLETAVSDTSITAWVAANDTFAVECIELLDQWGIEVPRQVSVMGFDDGMDALLHGITSYNFNAPGVMHAMLDHILTYGSKRRPARGGKPVEIEGYIAERDSCARRAGGEPPSLPATPGTRMPRDGR